MILYLIGNNEIARHADTGVPGLGLGEKKFPQDLVLFGGNLGEGYAVGDDTPDSIRCGSPDYRRVHLDLPVFHLEAKMNSGVDWHGLGQFHTGAPMEAR